MNRPITSTISVALRNRAWSSRSCTISPSAIPAMTGTSRAQQQQLESSLRAKLGAFSKAHLITRAFVLGVLLPRCLTVLLIVATLGNGAQQDAIAQRLPRRPTQTASARLMRTQRGSSAGGRRS